MSLNIKEEPLKQLWDSFLTQNMSLNIKEEPLERSENSIMTRNMSVNIKEESLEQSGDSVLIHNISLNIKEEPLEQSENSILTHNMSLNVKEEPLEQSGNYFLSNNKLLSIKEETLDHCQSFYLLDNQPLHIQIESIEKSQNFSLATNTHSNIKEEPLELSDKMSLNIEDNISKIAHGSLNSSIDISANKNSTIINETSDEEKPLVLLHASSLRNNVPSNIKEEVIALPNTSTDIIENATYVPLKVEVEDELKSEKNKAKNFEQLSHITHNWLFFAKNTENSANKTFSNEAKIKRNFQNAEKICINNEQNKEISNAVSNSVAENSTKRIKITNASKFQSETNEEKCNIENILHPFSGAQNQTIATHSIINKISNEYLKVEWPNSGNFKMASDNEFLNERDPKMLDAKSLLQSSSFPAHNLIFIVKNTGNSLNIQISDKSNDSSIIRNLGEAGMKNGSQLQIKQDEKKCNPISLLRSLELNGVHDILSPVKDTVKFVDQEISNGSDESTKLENLKETRKENVSQFQSEFHKGKPHPRSVLISSYAAQKLTFPGKNVGKLINIQNKHCEDNSPSHAANNMEKSMNKKISPEFSKSKAGVRALIYDRINTTQKTARMKLLEPLFKYVQKKSGFESKSPDTNRSRRHLTCHLPGKNFKCDACNKLFSYPESLSKHKANVHGQNKNEVEISCAKCDKKFYTLSEVNSHLQSHDSTSKVCSICNREFKTRASLEEHYRIHTGETPFTCIVCNRAFRTRNILKLHTLRHKAVKIYKCSMCDKSYNNKGLLTVHMNSHKEVSDVKCHICRKTFDYKSNLYQHMFVHFPRRRHQCEACGLWFKLSDHLKSHISTHHCTTQ